MTRLCVPLTAGTCEEMAREIEAARAAGAEMIELRLDCLSRWDHESVRALVTRARQFGGPVIATCRLASEGGHWDGDEAERISLLELAGLAGADYLDVEYEAWRASANIRQKIGLVCGAGGDADRPRRRLILSKHDCTQTPANLEAILVDLKREPCNVVKLACTAETITDALRMLEALRNTTASHEAIALSMGEAGLLTRVLARKFGALLTFAALEPGKTSAPGQLSVSQMRSVYRWDAITAATRVFGVIGCPVAHSMSPAIMNAAFEAIGYDGVYLPMRVEPDYGSFAAFMDGCLSRPWLDLRGCSVTIPHKANLLRYVEQRGGQIEPLARRIGAANTLCIEPGQRADGRDAKLSASNTDYLGARDALCAGLGIAPDGLRDVVALVLGAGGAGRAIVAGLRDAGSRIVICNRTAAKAQALAEEFGAQVRPWDERTRLAADAVINCTSIGMWPDVDDTPLPEAALRPGTVVFDTVYNPIETRLLREARQSGCTTIDGVAMFVNQAVAQFERWTGSRAPRELMRDVVIGRLAQ